MKPTRSLRVLSAVSVLLLASTTPAAPVTPRGWHERIYPDFEYHQNPRFQQATRVRLYYNGALTSDITWEHCAVNAPIADEVFVLEAKGGAAPGAGGSR